MNSLWPERRRGAPKASKKAGLALIVIIMWTTGTAVFMAVSGATNAFLYPPHICGDGKRPITCLTIASLLLIIRFVAGYPTARRRMKVCPGVALRYKKGMKENPSFLP